MYKHYVNILSLGRQLRLFYNTKVPDLLAVYVRLHPFDLYNVTLLCVINETDPIDVNCIQSSGTKGCSPD